MRAIYKKCLFCNQFYESKLGSINEFCGLHQAEFEKWVLRHVQSRNIPYEAYDVYEKVITDGKEHFYHVCRQCGASLLTKTGKHSSQARYCRGNHNNEVIELPLYLWSITKDTYLRKLQLIQKPKKVGLICALMKESIAQPNDSSLYKYYMNNMFICEECGHLIKKIQVHHILAVFLLTIENWQLAFDLNNLIGLCHKCHKPKHHEVHLKVGEQLAIHAKGYRDYRERQYRKRMYMGTKATNLTDFIKK